MLRSDGSIRTAEGYDPEKRLWCVNVPELEIPERPTEDQARAALQTLRGPLRTFPFADSQRMWSPELGLELVELAQLPGRDESAFLTGLMTAACRRCLLLAPGLMLISARLSGSGSGKGLLAHSVCLIGYGYRPATFTAGKGDGELGKGSYRSSSKVALVAQQCQRRGFAVGNVGGRDDRTAGQGSAARDVEDGRARRRCGLSR